MAEDGETAVVETVVDNEADADEEVVKQVEGLTFEPTDDDKKADDNNASSADVVADADAAVVADADIEIVYANVWKKMNGKARLGAMALWESTFGADMPCHIKNSRLEALCAVAYAGDEVIAVSTIGIEMPKTLYAKVGWFRCLVKPEFRKRHIATELAVRAKAALEEWSIENPHEAVLAFGTFVESPLLLEHAKNPIWPRTGLTIVGYTQKGMQIRVAWFKHARVEY